MEAFAIYILKSSGLIALFYLCYRVLLEEETFFQANRHFLIAGILISFVLPYYNLTKTILIDTVAISQSDIENNIAPVISSVEAPFDWWQLVVFVYSIGFLFFLGRLVVQLLSLRKLIINGKQHKRNGFTIIETHFHTSPFSFFNYIVYNPILHEDTSLETIIAHEKVHAKQKHSADVLILHLLCIVQWFNPFAWRYKKTTAQNLEYIADAVLTQNASSKKDYQYLLLNQSVNQQQPLTIINPFFNSLIKKRIIMINQKKSSPFKTIKYALVLPFLAIFLVLFNTKTIAQAVTKPETDIKVTAFSITVNKNSTSVELKHAEDWVKKDFNIDLRFYGIKRNKNHEIISLKSDFKDSLGNSGTWKSKSSLPIKPFRFHFEYNANDELQTIGYEGVNEDNSKTINSNFEVTGLSYKDSDANTDLSIKISALDISGDKADEYINISSFSDLVSKKPIVIIDGVNKGYDYKAIKVKYSELDEMSIQEASAKTSEKYGEIAKNGVIEIKTKKK